MSMSVMKVGLDPITAQAMLDLLRLKGLPNHELSSLVSGSKRLVSFSVLYWLAAVEEKAMAVPAPMLGRTATVAEII